ncbi:MAG: DUF3127 domain-containing protein [Bacteroidales bacterium]|nr:DUF3127 domain-containing protein [Bacteroidales bacterium]
MENTINGKLIEICEPQTGTSANGQWKRQNFIIETFAQYPRKLCFTVSNDKVDMSRFAVGSVVMVYINIESREYNGKWFTDFRAWRVDDGQPLQPNNTIQGRVTNVFQEIGGKNASTGREWKRQDFVIETVETYPKKIYFSVWGDKTNKSALVEGKEVTVNVDLESRQGSNGGWFSSVQAFRVTEGIVQMGTPAGNSAYGVASDNTATGAPMVAPDPITPDQLKSNDESDGLPF